MDTARREAAGTLEAQARTALGEMWKAIRWSYWVRLEWRRPTSAETANSHLERLMADLERHHPTIRLVAGFHADPYPHAHAMLALSRRHGAQFLTAEEFRDWLARYWYHGRVWAQVFDPTKRSSEHGGAVEYLARAPGTVVWRMK